MLCFVLICSVYLNFSCVWILTERNPTERKKEAARVFDIKRHGLNLYPSQRAYTEATRCNLS